MKILIRYQKKGLMRFVSHLDTERVWRRAIRRADIPVVITQGFSPKEKLEMGYPLPVGCESEGEDLIIDLAEPLPVDEIRMRLIVVLPEGFGIVSVTPYTHRDSLFQRTREILYQVQIPLNPPLLKGETPLFGKEGLGEIFREQTITIPVVEGKSKNLWTVLCEDLEISPDEARLLKVTRIGIQYKE
ncbi:MAG: TIGR03936 family radical SAM-associated protein [Candidatus Omnitrophota bacterium]